MGYHSADYDHDWKIGVAELARVTALYNTLYSGTGVGCGCYKTDPHSIDGFAPDTFRDPSLPVVLDYYHSADFDRDGNIDSGELLRVVDLYDTEVNAVRTGDYHVSPDTIDGFAPSSPSVELSHYQFDEAHPPVISSHNTLPSVGGVSAYRLFARFADGSTSGFEAATSLNNSGFTLDEVPPPGTYSVDLWWVKYTYSGVNLVVSETGVTTTVTVSISPAAPNLDPTECAQCGFTPNT